MKSSVLWFPHVAHNVLWYHRRPSMASLHSLNAEGFAVVRVNCRVVRLCRSRRLCLNIQSIYVIEESYCMSHIKMAFVGTLFLFHAIHVMAVKDSIASYRWMENVERIFLARVCTCVRIHLMLLLCNVFLSHSHLAGITDIISILWYFHLLTIHSKTLMVCCTPNSRSFYSPSKENIVTYCAVFKLGATDRNKRAHIQTAKLLSGL